MKKELNLIAQALTMGYEMNNIPHLGGEPCCDAFSLGRTIAKYADLPELMVDLAIESGEYQVPDLERILGMIERGEV